MQVTTYLYFRGQCEEALKCYEATLGARVGLLFRYAGSPMAGDVPTDWQDKIMHGNLTIGDQAFMVGDVAPDRYEEPKGFSLSLQLKDAAEAERIYSELAKAGRILMPLEKTFWAERFGMVVDRFGIPWMLDCSKTEG